MAGEIISVVAQATQSSWVDTPVMSSVSESDAGRLADLLSMQEVQQAPAPSSISQMAPSNNSIGDAILRSLDSAGKSYKAKASEIDLMMNGETAKITTTDLLRMQFQLIDASMQVDLISKAISKGTQHIDQLTKLQ